MSERVDEPTSELAESIGTFVSGGDTIEGAVRRLERLGVPRTLLENAQRHYERKVGRIRDLKEPGSLVDKDLTHGYWYPGPKASDVFWPALKTRIAPTLGHDGLEAVDRSSDKIIGLMRPPGSENIGTRGLVLGYVQSGKTTNFMSVISKAADVGYRLFIVLSGITDNLRSQTQERLEDVLVGKLEKQWFLLTDLDSDFQLRDNAPNLLSRSDHRLLAVVKKNPYRLHRLVKWLESAGELTLRNCPILLIDDEADQASLDVGTHGRTSRINGLIGQLLDNPKAAYVAYTATPFANLLSDAKDYAGLYPRDFIVDLPLAETYFGPERIFGREPLTPDEDGSGITEGLDLVRRVEVAEIPEVQPPRGRGAVHSWTPSMAPSLRDAVMWFLLATAARRERSSRVQHASMLIHTSMLAEAHVRLSEPVRDLLSQLRASLADGDLATLNDLKTLWEKESTVIPPQDSDTLKVGWDAVQSRLGEVVEDTRIIIDNYMSNERLSYRDDEPTTAIVIGGNTLSRGLTLHGLVCSYFVRSASAYDTVMQMGRWFGYWQGYGDLVRVWMTSELESWFFDLASVEEEVRRDIRRYEQEGLRPSEVAVRIRTHPAMAISSAAKMRHRIKAEVSYGKSKQQTILFNHHDEEWLKANQSAARNLVGSSRAAGIEVEKSDREGRFVLRGVPVEAILGFLEDYRFHENAFQMRSELLAGYIQTQNDQGFLRRWNVAILGHPNDGNGTINLGLDEMVNLIVRSRMDMPAIPHANIKTLVSTIDRVADVRYPTAEITAMIEGPVTDDSLLTLREQLIGDVGLLCLYPISKDSRPKEPPKKDGKRRRLPLEAVEDMVGVGFFFPESRGLTGAYTYYSADLSAEPVEEVEDIDAIDAIDEAAGQAADEKQE